MSLAYEVRRMRQSGSSAEEIARHIASKQDKRWLRNALLTAGLIGGLGIAAARNEGVREIALHYLNPLLHTVLPERYSLNRFSSPVVYAGLSDPKRAWFTTTTLNFGNINFKRVSVRLFAPLYTSALQDRPLPLDFDREDIGFYKADKSIYRTATLQVDRLTGHVTSGNWTDITSVWKFEPRTQVPITEAGYQWKDPSGKTITVKFNQDTMFGIREGAVIWKINGLPNITEAGVLSDSGEQGRGKFDMPAVFYRSILLLQPDPDTLRAVDIQTGRELWKRSPTHDLYGVHYTFTFSEMRWPWVHNGALVLNHDSGVVLLDIKTGCEMVSFDMEYHSVNGWKLIGADDKHYYLLGMNGSAWYYGNSDEQTFDQYSGSTPTEITVVAFDR